LIAIALPASTYPLQIVQAARFLEKKKKKPDLKPRENWDTSILGLLNYPEVIQIMNEDLDWTWKLGEAVVSQQKDVIDAIQQMRARAHAAGNLTSNKQQVIVVEKETIIIKSADPKVIYVPQYDPAVVIVQQPAPVTIIYSNPYPVYYNPAATFFTGMFVGAAISYGIGWHDHHISYNHGNVNIDNSKNVNINKGGSNTWKPGNQSGARPGTRPGSRPGSMQRGNLASRTGGSVRSRTTPQRSGSGARSRVGSSPRSSRSGAFGGYGRGYKQASYSKRGRQSRSVSRRSRGRVSSSRSGRSSSGRRGRRR